MAKNPHAVALGRLGGRVKSAAKTAAVRANATRPRIRRKVPQAPQVPQAGEKP